MLHDKTIVVIVPSFNVEGQIEKAVRGLCEYVDHIIIVDDYSEDKTIEVVEKIPDDRIILLRNKKNEGVGGATKAGLKKALELGGDIFVKYDGDGQMDPSRMEDIISPLLEGYDYAKGNRFIHINQLKTMPFLRLIGSFVLTFLTKLASGYWNIFDPQNGYVGLTREKAELLPVKSLHNRYFFENDILIQMNIIEAKVKDISMPSKYGNEKSSMKVQVILLTFPYLLFKRFILRIYKKYILFKFSVIGLFYFSGLLLLIFGTLFGLHGWIESIVTGTPATTGTVMIATLPIIIGFQLFLQAIVLEIEECEK